MENLEAFFEGIIKLHEAGVFNNMFINKLTDNFIIVLENNKEVQFVVKAEDTTLQDYLFNSDNVFEGIIDILGICDETVVEDILEEFINIFCTSVAELV